MPASLIQGSKRVAVASFEFEGNDFSPKVKGREGFDLYGVGTDVWRVIEGCPLAVTGGVEVLHAAGDIELVPILVAHGGSGGTVEPGFYRQTTDAIVAAIREQGPFDGVFLALHGAMVSPGVQDAEGELLSSLREVVGEDAVVAASLDLHAHVSARMVAAADILVGYANYPHDDAHDTGMRAAALLRDSLAGLISPVMRMRRLDMLVPVTGSNTREADAPLAQVRAFARSLETGGVLSTSYFTAQPWLDDPEAGCVGLAITDGSAALADATAEKIADRLWSLRAAFEVPLYPVQEAIARARQASVRPVILGDAADCVGAGASGDAAFVLAALLRDAPDLRAAVTLVDPEVAALAHRKGLGARLSTHIGYRLDARYGEAVAIDAEVLALHDGRFTYSAGPAAGVLANMGPSAVLKAGNTLILVTSVGTYEYADEQFRAAGIDPDSCDILVLKNGMNFRNLLRPGSTWMLLDSVGASSPKLAALAWRNRPDAFWPREPELQRSTR